MESLDYVYRTGGAERLHEVLRTLHRYAKAVDADLPFTANTPYVNTIPPGTPWRWWSGPTRSIPGSVGMWPRSRR